MVTKTLEVGKETTEIFEGIAELIADIKAGKDIPTITAENLPNLIKMVEGYEQVLPEMKMKERNATIAYGGYVVVEALAPVEVEG